MTSSFFFHLILRYENLFEVDNSQQKKLAELGSKVHKSVATAKPYFLHEIFSITFFHLIFCTTVKFNYRTFIHYL